MKNVKSLYYIQRLQAFSKKMYGNIICKGISTPKSRLAMTIFIFAILFATSFIAKSNTDVYVSITKGKVLNTATAQYHSDDFNGSNTIDITSDGQYKLIFDSNIKEISVDFFRNNNNIIEVIGSNVEVIKSYAFERCFALEIVDFPEIKHIERHAFANCIALNSATLTKARSIGDLAFRNCNKLSSLTLGLMPPTLGRDIFEGTNLLEVTNFSLNVPGQSLNAYQDWIKSNSLPFRMGWIKGRSK
ncbi:MAG: leucine-rich repeat domain-containing protein [Bacteroidetes bacterium]|nr:leucine-rich repeat domain-containing protein [Bacteroidota bacterium]